MASVPGGGASALDGQKLVERLNEVSNQVGAAIAGGDAREQAIARLERAVVEMQLRDLHGPWSREGDRYATWMRDDVKIARNLARELAAKLGDYELPLRLLRPHPELRRVVTW